MQNKEPAAIVGVSHQVAVLVGQPDAFLQLYQASVKKVIVRVALTGGRAEASHQGASITRAGLHFLHWKMVLQMPYPLGAQAQACMTIQRQFRAARMCHKFLVRQAGQGKSQGRSRNPFLFLNLAMWRDPRFEEPCREQSGQGLLPPP